MTKKYGNEYTKALAVMIARGDFNESSGNELTINDLDTYLEYVDLDKVIETNSVELKMLLGGTVDTTLVQYFNSPDTVSVLKLTGLDLLLFSSINNSIISNKLLNHPGGDFSKIAYTLSNLIDKNYLKEAELIIDKGSSLNNVYPGSKITIWELQVISCISSLVLSKNENIENAINRVNFILKYRDNLTPKALSMLEGVLNANVEFISKVYMPDLKLNESDIFSKIEEFAKILVKYNKYILSLS